MYQHIDKVFQMNLKSGEKLVMLALAKCADEKGQCYPSMDYIAELTGLTRRSIQRHITSLKNTDLIQVSKRQWDKQPYPVNFYTLKLIDKMSHYKTINTDNINNTTPTISEPIFPMDRKNCLTDNGLLDEF